MRCAAASFQPAGATDPRRLQCARTYETEAQIRHVVADFETWSDLRAAGFPPVGVPAHDVTGNSSYWTVL